MSDNGPQNSESGAKRLTITEADLGITQSRHAQAGSPQAPASTTGPRHSSPGEDEGERRPAWNEATRLMCAAAYLDGTFAQDVVDEIIYEQHRAVHIPTGVNIELVAKHCLAALRQKLIRDWLLVVDVVASFILLVAKHSLVWPLLGFLLAWAIVSWDIWSSTYLVVVRHLSPKQFGVRPPPEPIDPNVARRIQELARDQRGNLTVYSGFLPFSGAGIDVGGWSFLINLTRGKQDVFGDRAAASELTAADLYDTTQSALAALGMTNLEIRDRLFVSGADVRDDRTLMPDLLGPPQSWVDLSVVRQHMASPTHRIRHYRCIEIEDWHGELIMSMFLRFSISNDRLFCELNKFVLVPLKEELHRLNHLGGRVRLKDLTAMGIRAVFATPGLSLRALTAIFKPFRRTLKQSSSARYVQNDEFFDYGAPVTALDRVRSTKYRRYFQRLDKEMYDKVLERTVLDSIVETLDRHGIDTGEIAARTAAIINNGIMMKDSTLGANNLAVGSKSRIQVNLKLPGSGDGAPPPAAGNTQHS